MNALRALLAFGGLVLVSSTMTGVARACGVPNCFHGWFHPGEAEVPANLPGLFWRPEHGSGTAPAQGGALRELTFERVVDGGAVPVAIALSGCESRYNGCVVRPLSPLSPGTYLVRAAGACDGGTPSSSVNPATARLQVVAPAPFPTALGVLSVENLGLARATNYNDWGCQSLLSVVVLRITLRLDDSVGPWLHSLRFDLAGSGAKLRIDGNTMSPLTTTVHALCGSFSGQAYGTMPPGRYSLTATAAMPGGDLVLSSNTVLGETSCEGAPNPWPDGGAVYLQPDAGQRDAGAGPSTATSALGCSSNDARAATFAWVLCAFWVCMRRRRPLTSCSGPLRSHWG